MTDGTTGQIVFQSTNSSQVFSNTVGNCSVGSSIDIESGVYWVNTMWTMMFANNVTLNFERGAKLIAGNNLNTSVLMLFQSNNNTVNGVTIDGNAANVPVNDDINWQYGSPGQNFYMTTSGIYIAGSNNEVNEAQIYNCRMYGVLIWQWGLGSAVHSGVIDSKIYNCGWNGFTVGTNFCLNNYLINSEIYGCSDVGATTYGIGTFLIGNYIHDLNGTTGGGGNAEWGIAVEGGQDNVITENTINNTGWGIMISNSGHPTGTTNNNTISNNKIVNCNSGITSNAGGIGLTSGSAANLVTHNEILTVLNENNPWLCPGIFLENF